MFLCFRIFLAQNSRKRLPINRVDSSSSQFPNSRLNQLNGAFHHFLFFLWSVVWNCQSPFLVPIFCLFVNFLTFGGKDDSFRVSEWLLSSRARVFLERPCFPLDNDLVLGVYICYLRIVNLKPRPQVLECQEPGWGAPQLT